MKEFELRCPVCEGIQYCPCSTCVESHKEETVWEWHDTGLAAVCGHCGYKARTDYWIEEQDRQHRAWKRVQGIKDVSINYQVLDEDDGYPD